jgi:hypothetical protein
MNKYEKTDKGKVTKVLRNGKNFEVKTCFDYKDTGQKTVDEHFEVLQIAVRYGFILDDWLLNGIMNAHGGWSKYANITEMTDTTCILHYSDMISSHQMWNQGFLPGGIQ